MVTPSHPATSTLAPITGTISAAAGSTTAGGGNGASAMAAGMAAIDLSNVGSPLGTQGVGMAAGGGALSAAASQQAKVDALTHALAQLAAVLQAMAAGQAAASGNVQLGAWSPLTVSGGGGARSAAGADSGIRRSAIPTSANGNVDATIGVGQTTYRQVVLSGGAGGATYQVPGAGRSGGVGYEVFAVRDYVSGAHRTQVLVPAGGTIQLRAGEQVRLLVRMTGMAPGTHTANLGFGTLTARVANTTVRPLSMMTWVNATNAQKRGATQAGVEGVLQHFGVTSTGATGSPTSGGVVADRYYFSAAYEAANRQPVGDVARRILEAERRLAGTNPGATLWVQVSDEQDTTAGAVNGTVAWISQLRQVLAASGSRAKLFVATQARDYNMAYASVVDGWATTQSTLGANSRASAIQRIQAAARAQGRSIEVMEYPGNAFFDGGTASSAAISVASAGLDGASSWFLFAANNLDTLERGVGEEGRGDIGGLVAISGGTVYPTLALAEAEYGSNLAGMARVAGTTAAATQVRTAAANLDAYKHGSTVDFARWEREMATALVG